MSCGDTSTVTFTGNSAKYSGGAIVAIDSSCIFHGHTRVTFSRNHAGLDGGAIGLFVYYDNFFCHSVIAQQYYSLKIVNGMVELYAQP